MKYWKMHKLVNENVLVNFLKYICQILNIWKSYYTVLVSISLVLFK